MIKWQQLEKRINKKDVDDFIEHLPLDVDYLSDEFQGIRVGQSKNGKIVRHIFWHDPSDTYWIILEDAKGKFYEKGFEIT